MILFTLKKTTIIKMLINWPQAAPVLFSFFLHYNNNANCFDIILTNIPYILYNR